MQQPTILRCSRPTAFLVLLLSTALFVLVGCAALFRSAGLSPEQSAKQTAELKTALADAVADAVVDVQTGLAEGQDLKSLAVKTSTTLLWKILAAAGTTAGVVLNGLLAKWLKTERKISNTLITGVEAAKDNSVKKTIQHVAERNGIETKLHRRVLSLT